MNYGSYKRCHDGGFFNASSGFKRRQYGDDFPPDPGYNKRQRIAPPRDIDEELKSSTRGRGEEGSAAKGEFRPSMLSFKAFLSTQDDSITDDEALEKFSEYKKEFNRQQINEFFVAHKDEEWMMERYYPDRVNSRKDDNKEVIQNRVKVFMEMHEEGLMDDIQLVKEDSDKLELLLDTFVARLEGADIVGLLEADGPDRAILSRTTSIHLRSLLPTIGREDLLAVLMKYPGFRRLCLSDPSAETKWRRKGWATFDRDARIKEFCLSLSNVRIKDSDLTPVLNKDLSQRIRGVDVKYNDKALLRFFLHQANQLIRKLDTKWELWTVKQNEVLGEESGNPLLENIAEYLVEEMSAEEEEFLGSSANSKGGQSIEYDTELCTVLDKLVLYLRLVHSIDMYNTCHYATEHEMPNRCGIFHVRDTLPATQISIDDDQISNLKENVTKNIRTMTASWSLLNDEQIKELGPKSDQEATDIFVQANTEELGSNKFLCTICTKKFKGEEFLKKHIFNKHAEKVDVVKKEVEFYNNYIRDPRRPALPEKPKQIVKPALQPKVEAKQDLDAISKPTIRDRLGVTGGIKDRLGYKKENFVVTYAAKDPRSVVDYSDVEFADIFS